MGGSLTDDFQPSAACKFLDLPPVSPRNLQAHLTKKALADRLSLLCGISLNPKRYEVSENCHFAVYKT
jgi:hypothetical protein